MIRVIAGGVSKEVIVQYLDVVRLITEHGRIFTRRAGWPVGRAVEIKRLKDGGVSVRDIITGRPSLILAGELIQDDWEVLA